MATKSSGVWLWVGIGVLVLVFLVVGFGGFSSTGRTVSGTCTDSDGGKNYYMKGTVSFFWFNQTNSSTDLCIPSATSTTAGKRLKEFYCDGDSVKSVDITCSKSCVDGACTYTRSKPRFCKSGVCANSYFFKPKN